MRPDLKLGNLEDISWEQIFGGEPWQQATDEGGGVPAELLDGGFGKNRDRSSRFAKVPKVEPLWWVLKNKIRVTLGLEVDFADHIDYSRVYRDPYVPQRVTYLDDTAPKRIRTKQEIDCTSIGEFENR